MIQAGTPAAPPSAADVLRARARALARPAVAAQAVDMLDVLEFHLAAERYAVETRHVREVRALQQLTPLPGTPDFISGIVNLRGRIVPVFDLLLWLHLPRPGLADLHRIVLVGDDRLELGILADVGVAVRQVARGSLQPPPSTLPAAAAACLLGVAADGLIVLDMDRLLADPRILVDDAADGPEPKNR